MKKRILATFLSAVTLISCSSALAADYSDVNQSAWYASYVNKISDLSSSASPVRSSHVWTT